jgi:DNA-binding transcriptional regulator GbsR (MarR family)
VPDQLPKSRREFIETTGRLCQMLGLPRSTGQIYGLLYLSPTPLSLDDIAELLSISKASASTGTRQLLSWQAVKEVWVPGDRRDHFEAIGDLRELLRAGYRNFFQPKLEKSGRKLDVLLAALDADRKDGAITKEEHAFCRERLNSLGKLQDRIQKMLPLAEKFL